MKHVFTLLAFALISSGLAQSDTVSIQTEWIEQFSNGYSAYFEDIAVVEDDLIVCGQWFQGIQANQLVVSVNENDGSLNWDHFRDCCSDHARYHEPHMIDGQLHCFGTQNGQGSSYFDAMFVRYDAASGAELDYTIWNVGGSNSFADVLIAEDSFLVLANGQGAQPLARFEDGAISTSTTIPYPNSIGRSIALLKNAGGIYSVGAGEGDNLPGLVKYSENLEVEWSQTIGDVGLRTVRSAFATSEGFTLIGEDLNVQSGFVMKVDLEGSVTQYQTFPPYLHASSRVGSIAVVDGAYVVTLIDFGPQNQTTWLLALSEDLEVVGQHQLAPNLSFSSLTGNMVADGQSVYISGFDSQVLGTESAGGQRTPTLIKVVVDLFVIPGCTDPEACNYEPTATDDDGSCLDCTLFADRCGEGTVWDDESQTCVVANPSDTDFDGCVSMTDLLDLLTVFGTCADQPSDDTNELPAVEDALYVMDNSIFDQAQEFTIAARAAFNGAESSSIIYRQIEGGEMQLSHYDGVLNFQVKASNGNCYTASGWVYAQTALADEDLHHIVATYDRTEGEISLSIDGEVRVIQSVNGGDLADCDHYEAAIGNESVQDWRLAEIGFYQFAWTADQIEAYSTCVDLVDLDFNAPTVLLPIGTSPDGAAEVLESYEPLQILGSPGVVTCE